MKLPVAKFQSEEKKGFDPALVFMLVALALALACSVTVHNMLPRARGAAAKAVRTHSTLAREAMQ